MGKFERSYEDGSPLAWEYQEKYDSFETWYWRTIKKPFIVWWVITGLLSAVFLFGATRDIALVDNALHGGNHGWMFFTSGLLLFLVPLVVCPILSSVIANRFHRSRIDESLKRTFGDNADAKECLEQIRRAIPFM